MVLKKMPEIRLNKNKLRKLELTKDPFASLTSAIISQQLSTKSAASILKKFLTLFPKKYFPSPKDVLKLTDEDFKSVGVSPQKRGYVKDLATKFTDGTIDHTTLHTMELEMLKTKLISIKGIGPWTIDMFLIFALNHPDILPVGDLGIMKGFQKVFKLKKLPSASEMQKLAEPYKGKRTYLSLYLWQALDGNNNTK